MTYVGSVGRYSRRMCAVNTRATRVWRASVAFSSLLLLTVALAGCGERGSEEATRASGAAIRADGRLTVDPPLLSPKDITRQPAGSPQRRVVEQLFWAQYGNLPNVLAAYDSSVWSAVPPVEIVSTYQFLRPSLAVIAPKIRVVKQSRTRGDVLVGFHARSAPPSQHSFSLRRVDGTWKIFYDTLLDRGLLQYAGAKGLEGETKPSATSQRQAEDLARQFRAFAARRVVGEMEGAQAKDRPADRGKDRPADRGAVRARTRE